MNAIQGAIQLIDEHKALEKYIAENQNADDKASKEKDRDALEHRIKLKLSHVDKESEKT